MKACFEYLIVAVIAVLMALAGVGICFAIRAWEADSVDRQIIEARLKPCLGRPAREVVADIKLGGANWYGTDEPPMILRGVSYYPADGSSVTIYIAASEPLFRRFSEKGEWDYDAFLGCRVGGIQYRLNDIHVDSGPDVPWQFRTP